MKKKLMCIMLLLSFAVGVSACGNGQQDANRSENGTTSHAPQSKNDTSSEKGEQKDGSQNPQAGTVSASAFSGKVSDCYYGGGDRIVVVADKLYLYDTQKGENIASADISLEELYVQTYSDGYFLVGREKNGDGDALKGYLLNREFKIESTVSFRELLSDDIVTGTERFAISQNGKQIAFGGLQGLYLYDTSSKKIRTILNYSENGRTNNMEIVTMDNLTFTKDNALAYVGQGTGSGGGDGFSVYGTVSTDGSNLTITKKADYEVAGEEVQRGGNFLIMPQVFNKNNGTLLMLDTASNAEKMMTFASKSEGKDGVFCSEQGKYVATSMLGETSVTINIYDTTSGKLVHTETVKDSNSTYFLRVPQILILDESGTCIVVLGKSIGEVNTLITTFGFGR